MSRGGMGCSWKTISLENWALQFNRVRAGRQDGDDDRWTGCGSALGIRESKLRGSVAQVMSSACKRKTEWTENFTYIHTYACVYIYIYVYGSNSTGWADFG